MKYIGIDGCKKGWFLVILKDKSWEVDVVEKVQDLSKYATDKNDVVVIDIPIGLTNNKTERECDLEARKILGSKRSSSVFRVPCEDAVYCTTYDECSVKNFEITGKKVSAQGWGIVPKIREVDAYIKRHKPSYTLIESHPEVAFWSLNDYRDLSHGKKEDDGIKERLNILKSHQKNVEEIYKDARQKFSRKDLASDDIVDAICMAVIAYYKSNNLVKSLPEAESKNQRGIDMKIYYYSKNSVRKP